MRHLLYIKPIGFIKWSKVLDLQNGNEFQIKKTLEFIFKHLLENKFKIFRWKLLHFILPCKNILYKWKIVSDDKCSLCHKVEDYEHYFLKCSYLNEFWNKIKILFTKLQLGTNLITMKSLVIGYKIYDKAYFEINLLITIISYAIFKSMCI